MKDNTPTGRSRVFLDVIQALSSRAKEFTQTSDFASNTWCIAQKSGEHRMWCLSRSSSGQVGGFDISDLWSYYTDQQFDVVLVTGAQHIWAAYASYYQYDAPPLLVSRGSIRTLREAHPCPTSILDGNFFGHLRPVVIRWMLAGGSDYTDVDHDGSGWPLPEFLQKTKANWICGLHARSAFDDGVNVDHSAHVAFGDGEMVEESTSASCRKSVQCIARSGSLLTAIREPTIIILD